MTGLQRYLVRRRREDESGYVAAWTAIAAMLLIALCSFSVDVGNWYLTGQRVQRAADAGALAGVTRLPGSPTNAYAVARNFASQNGYGNAVDTDGDGTVDSWVTTQLDGSSTRLRVTVTHTVQNAFGSLFGEPETTITRTAVADYSGPVAMGSPCNLFGDDPTGSTVRSTSCADNGKFWASVSARSTDKVQGDAYQSIACGDGGDQCPGVNSEYEEDGYFYTLHVERAVSNLTIELYDPGFASMGTTCGTNFGSGDSEAIDARNNLVAGNTEATVYAPGATNPHCTADYDFGYSSTTPSTRFQVRSEGAFPWDPTSFPLVSGCSKTYKGYDGSLFNVLDQFTSGTTPRSTYDAAVAGSFRRWSTLCTIPNAQPGDYLIQVNTNGLGFDDEYASNHFSMRAYSTSDTTAKDVVSISGRGKMSVFTNADGATSSFQLARVPSAAAGQSLVVRLFDIGDSDNGTTTLTVRPPKEFGTTATYTGCTASGPTTTMSSTCSFNATRTSHQGRWQEVVIPIPSTYTCDDTLRSKCWARLTMSFSAGGVPHDVTSWQANIIGDPVRLVE